jgi:hypothetical protein
MAGAYSVDSYQRFSASHPCPICGGYDRLRRGAGDRCYGFASADGKYAHCTRPEHAGLLAQKPLSCTYAHRLAGACKCGLEHGVEREPISDGRRDRTRRYEPQEMGTIDSHHVYFDEERRPVHRTVRFRDPKHFLQQRYQNGRWRWGLKDIRTVLYYLPELLAADPDTPVFLPEGEKDVDRLRRLGLVSTTNPMGARSWRPHYRGWLEGRHVVILEDNDDDGRARSGKLYGQLRSVARSVRIVAFPGIDEGGDVSDWLDAGGSISDLTGEIDRRSQQASA